MTKDNSCCVKNNQNEKNHGFFKGLLYGLIPHAGCFAFIGFTILGLTAGAAFLKPLLNTYFFYGLITFSLILTTISAIFYLKKNSSLSKEGIKRKWKYLTILYGTAIFINVLFLTVIFPYASNTIFAGGVNTIGLFALSNNNTINNGLANISTITLNVNIPCGGHAALIIGEVKKDPGVISTKYSFPSNFTVKYDNTKTDKDKILANPIFKEYPAKVV